MKLLEQYVGDGVYVSFDGYHVNVALNDHRNHVAAFDDQVRKRLIEYFKEVDELIAKGPGEAQ